MVSPTAVGKDRQAVTKYELWFVHAITVIGIYHIYDAMRFLIVLVPQRLQLLLASQVPEIEAHTLHIDGANVETHCRCDFGRIEAFVVLGELRFGRFQISLWENFVYLLADVELCRCLPFCPHCPGPKWRHSIRLFVLDICKSRAAVCTCFLTIYIISYIAIKPLNNKSVNNTTKKELNTQTRVVDVRNAANIWDFDNSCTSCGCLRHRIANIWLNCFLLSANITCWFCFVCFVSHVFNSHSIILFSFIFIYDTLDTSLDYRYICNALCNLP